VTDQALRRRPAARRRWSRARRPERRGYPTRRRTRACSSAVWNEWPAGRSR